MFFKTKKDIKVLVEVSARHCHLSQSDVEKLFGAGYELKKMKELSQPSDFACQETVEIEFGSKKIQKVRIVGPIREQSQVEVSLTDNAGSGVEIPLRLSGDLKNSTGVILRGPAGEVELNEGLIIAKRHLHCAIDEAKKMGLKTGDIVSVKVPANTSKKEERSVIFENVIVRVKDNYRLSMQIDTDEGNASGINKVSSGVISHK